MDKNKSENNNNNKESFKYDELDFQLLAPFLLRNKRFIFLITLITFIFACFISIIKKRTYEGRFEIVLEKKTSLTQKQLSKLPTSQIFNLPGVGSTDLKTEVGILQSPSILMPIFNYVLKEKSKNGLKVNNLNFNKWKNNYLIIDLKKNTSILDISYRDNDKDLISSVLDKMSSAYQNYSSRNIKRSQVLTKKYLEEQIAIYKEKSSKSLKMAQDFSTDQDLVLFEFETDYGAQNDDRAQKKLKLVNNDSFFNTRIEQIRVQAANKIREIDLQIAKIKELENDFEKLQYISSTVPLLIEAGLTEELKEIESEIVDIRSKYTEEDPLLKQIISKRDLLIGLLKKRTLGFLKAQRLVAESRMEAAMRPKGILLNYKELVREAGRDEETLINLENQLRITQLQIAKRKEPWELITKPTILNQPIAPNRKVYGIFGLFVGFVLGILLTFIKERKSDKLYSQKILEQSLSLKTIEIIKTDSEESLKESISFLKEVIESQSGKKVLLQPIGEFNSGDQIIIEKLLQNLSRDSKKDFCLAPYDQGINKFINAEIKLFIVILGQVTNTEIQKLKIRLENIDSNFNRLLLFKK